ncbi:hypothetical protein VPH35_135704 [Triticum aestivum]
MVAPARGRFVVPEHIRGHHDAAIGNFGVPDYGGTLTGVVLYPDKKATGCTEFPARFKSTSGRPVVLLLEVHTPHAHQLPSAINPADLIDRLIDSWLRLILAGKTLLMRDCASLNCPTIYGATEFSFSIGDVLTGKEATDGS